MLEIYLSYSLLGSLLISNVMIKYLALFLTIFCIDSVSFDLRDAVNISIHNNKQLNIAYQNLQKEISLSSDIFIDFLPDIQINWHRTSLNQNPQVRDYKEHSSSDIISLMLHYNIFNGGSSLCKVAYSNANISAAYQKYNQMFAEIIYHSITSYQNVLTSRSLLVIDEDLIKMAQKNLTKSEYNLKAGADTKSSIFIAQSQLSEIKAQYERHFQEYKKSEQEFYYYIGIMPPNNLENINILNFQQFSSVDDLLKISKTFNNVILNSKYEALGSKHAIGIYTSKISPSMSIFYKLDKYIPRLNTQQVTENNVFGISISIPLLSKGGIDYLSIDRAKKQHYIHNLKVGSTKDYVYNQVVNSWNNYITSKKILNEYESAQNSYLHTTKAIETEFEYGSKTIFEVITIQKEYHLSSIKKLLEERQFKLSFFELHKLAGNLSKLIL